MDIDARTRKRAAKLYGQPSPLVRSFVPVGRTRYVIYAVALAEHSGVTKVGRTNKWANRRKSYETWNLRSAGGIEEERVFTITDEFVDLPRLEEKLLASLAFPRRHGREWLAADFDSVCRAIERFLCDHGISYI